ncbi:MAG: HNH endonuclease [Bacteroidota bacterium]
MAKEKVKNIDEPVRHLLWGKSAGRCELRGCGKLVYRDDLTQTELNFADIAHIIGRRANGPRGNEDVSEDRPYCNNIENLMLLCLEHHRMIDRKAKNYSSDDLRQMKKEHEDRILLQTSVNPDRRSSLVFYRSNVGQLHPALDFHTAAQALLPNCFPANQQPIELGILNNPIADHDSDYWKNEIKYLERQFAIKVMPLLETGSKSHFSIFAFAPIPLLIKLGSLFADVYPVDIYQLHRNPLTWNWLEAPKDFDYPVLEPDEDNELIALNVSLSADITNDRIYDALGTRRVSIWKITAIANGHSKNDHLRSPVQLQLFANQYRRLLNRIKASHGQKQTLHVFPAAPISACVAMGRYRQAKADLPLQIYDQNKKRGGFYSTVYLN